MDKFSKDKNMLDSSKLDNKLISYGVIHQVRAFYHIV